jgi:cytochrome d ubiquinol oxidase subunit I
LLIGGIPDESTQTVKYAIELPGFLSFLAFGNFDAEVQGLNDFPENERPPVAITHYSFQIMVILGMLMFGVAALYFLFLWKWKYVLDKKWWLKLLVIMIPTGYLAIEAGWIVTELGRQPWIIYKVMRTKDALTSMPGLIYPLTSITIVYIALTLLSVFLLSRQIRFVNQDISKE